MIVEFYIIMVRIVLSEVSFIRNGKIQFGVNRFHGVCIKRPENRFTPTIILFVSDAMYIQMQGILSELGC